MAVRTWRKLLNTIKPGGNGSCHGEGMRSNGLRKVGIVGSPNVGKSLIFNQLTGSHQNIGNWPGKTVERAVGHLRLDGHNATIVDLPGIYSMSTFSQEEIVTRDYIAREKPDVVIKSPADVWLAISRGEMDGQSAFLSGRYKVEGNVGLLMKIKGMFG